MAFDLIITKHFEKTYIKKNLVTEKIIIDKAKEIEEGLFYNGEGRVKGSKILFKKRFNLENTSKRRGGRVLFVVFQKVQNVYVPYMVWHANNSRKGQFDNILKDKKMVEKIISETVYQMNI
jgi:hypothetical protein